MPWLLIIKVLSTHARTRTHTHTHTHTHVYNLSWLSYNVGTMQLWYFVGLVMYWSPSMELTSVMSTTVMLSVL